MSSRPIGALVAIVVLASGLLFLPAAAFALFSMGLMLIVRPALPPSRYGRVGRILVSMVIVGATAAFWWIVQLAFDNGQLQFALGLFPYLIELCDRSHQLFATYLPWSPSPACRFLLQDPRYEFGIGLVMQFLLTINLAWIRIGNLHVTLSARDFEQRSNTGTALMIFVLATLGVTYLSYKADLLAASLSGSPISFGQGVAYSLFGAIVVFCYLSLQGLLFSWTRRKVGLNE